MDDDLYNKAVETWYAGVECELADSSGLFGTDEEATFLGIGAKPRFVEQQGRGRFRNVADHAGLLGQRIAWTLHALHCMRLHAPAISDGRDEDGRRRDLLCRLAHRALAFLREGEARLRTDDDFARVRTNLRAGLRHIAATVRTHHAPPPHPGELGNGTA